MAKKNRSKKKAVPKRAKGELADREVEKAAGGTGAHGAGGGGGSGIGVQSPRDIATG